MNHLHPNFRVHCVTNRPSHSVVMVYLWVQWEKGDFRAEGVSLVAKVTAAPTFVPTLAPTTNGTNGTTDTPTAPPATATPTSSASNAAVSMALFVVLGLAYL